MSSNIVSEEFVLRSQRASPLMKPRLMPGGWHKVNFVYKILKIVGNHGFSFVSVGTPGFAD